MRIDGQRVPSKSSRAARGRITDSARICSRLQRQLSPEKRDVTGRL